MNKLLMLSVAVFLLAITAKGEEGCEAVYDAETETIVNPDCAKEKKIDSARAPAAIDEVDVEPVNAPDSGYEKTLDNGEQ